ncbi:glycosyltransferase family 2 protein [bacterium]|nr:glycosyltransferase family 2 protein [bacterium]
MNDRPPVSIVLLAYNEAGTIEDQIRTLHRVIVSKLPGSEIVVGEEGSQDGTSEILQALVQTLGIVHVTSKTRKGYREALRGALRQTRNPYVFFSDAGAKNDPEDFWKLYDLRDRHDLIIGRRVGRTDSLLRQALTYGYNFYLRQSFGLPEVHDSDSGFRIFNRRVVELILSPRSFFKNFSGSETVLRAHHQGLSVHEVSIGYRGRKGASRGMPTKRIPNAILGVLRDLQTLRREFAQNA